MNGILNGVDIPKEWKDSRVKLLHIDGRRDELNNYQPIAIISVLCKLCMLMVRKRINKWTEDSLWELVHLMWLRILVGRNGYDWNRVWHKCVEDNFWGDIKEV